METISYLRRIKQFSGLNNTFNIMESKENTNKGRNDTDAEIALHLKEVNAINEANRAQDPLYRIAREVCKEMGIEPNTESSHHDLDISIN